MTLAPASPRHAGRPHDGPHVDSDVWPSLAFPPSGPRTALGAWVAQRVFERIFGAMPLTVRLHEPAGVRQIGQGGPEAPVMEILRPTEFFARIGRDANTGFGESYMTGAWEADDLAALLEIPAARFDRFMPPFVHRLRRLTSTRISARERGSVQDTQDNIAAHYDLSNELFEQFLDPTMTYSSALFVDHAEELETAQVRKIEALLDLADVGPGTRLLEIGTGWGELALRAADRGATVRTLTLSIEQADLARRRIAAAGLADQVTVDLLDYRLVTGSYDAVVSVEMIEAVGWRHFEDYFATIARVLAPGGRAAIQAITMGHDRMLASKDSATWVTKYIFPGGFLPSVRQLGEAGHAAGLSMDVARAFGTDYAETLRRWDVAFTDHATAVTELGFDETFRRMWHYYLAYCQAGFAARYIDVHQLVFTQEGTR